MFIKGKEFDEELVIEIGKFAVLWNMFEKEHCETNCNPRKIRAAAPKLSIDQDKQKALVDVLNARNNIFQLCLKDYVVVDMYPRSAQGRNDYDTSQIKEFLEQNGENNTCGCLLAIYRIRNNLMHGLKRPEDLNSQRELFCAVNGVLESIEEINR